MYSKLSSRLSTCTPYLVCIAAFRNMLDTIAYGRGCGKSSYLLFSIVAEIKAMELHYWKQLRSIRTKQYKRMRRLR